MSFEDIISRVVCDDYKRQIQQIFLKAGGLVPEIQGEKLPSPDYHRELSSYANCYHLYRNCQITACPYRGPKKILFEKHFSRLLDMCTNHDIWSVLRLRISIFSLSASTCYRYPLLEYFSRTFHRIIRYVHESWDSECFRKSITTHILIDFIKFKFKISVTQRDSHQSVLTMEKTVKTALASSCRNK